MHDYNFAYHTVLLHELLHGNPRKHKQARPNRLRNERERHGAEEGVEDEEEEKGKLISAKQIMQAVRDRNAQREARQKLLEDHLESMSMAESKALLLTLARKHPEILLWTCNLHTPAPGGHHPAPSGDAPSWCTCGSCREMPTEVERCCCGHQPDECLSREDGLCGMVLDPVYLAAFELYRNDVLGAYESDPDDPLRPKRHAAYRLYTLVRHGVLGQAMRRVIPSCCVWRVRDRFPNPHAVYTGFKADRLA
ncbi:PREDICTED: uncharacterized protein LOC106817897 [Priapulus caudatus]|uniref:Uncharacterized protein LOC106817897 n=1 Tax=Priapulus caudatus TaxID=37621 RepID=A0ABM1F0X3_PRICU|nr:PREDICTED: uncharacterized protein LOC106817897 [Priapulus caudatus]